jgi:hypothetical protein
VGQLRSEREKKAMEVVIRVTREYLRWRNGQKWR